MAMVQVDSAIGDTAGVVFDVLEDFLRVDRPMRPSVQRRVQAANAEAIRTLRQLGAEDEDLLAPAHARTICNAIAQRHGIKPRFMLSMHELGEQLALEFASALMPSATRARLIRSAVHLERRRDLTPDPGRRRGSDRRPSPQVEWMAAVQATLALASMVVAAFMTHGGRDSVGLAFAIISVASLAFARAMLAISTDRRAHLASPTRPGATVTAPSGEIDLRAPDR